MSVHHRVIAFALRLTPLSSPIKRRREWHEHRLPLSGACQGDTVCSSAGLRQCRHDPVEDCPVLAPGVLLLWLLHRA